MDNTIYLNVSPSIFCLLRDSLIHSTLSFRLTTPRLRLGVWVLAETFQHPRQIAGVDPRMP